jgi:putative endonuclease
MAFVYILHSSKIEKFYIGSTDGSVEDRLKKHLTNHSGFPGKVKDWEIVYQEEFAEYDQAKRRELELKSWKSKIRIQILIDQFSSSSGSEHPA